MDGNEVSREGKKGYCRLEDSWVLGFVGGSLEMGKGFGADGVMDLFGDKLRYVGRG